MAKRTFEEKQKRQRDKLMGTTSTAEEKEYTPAVDEKDKFIEKYRKKGYKIILENHTPIILCKDRKEMMDIKERIGTPNFSIGFKFSPSKYDDLLDKPLIDDRIPVKNKGKTNNNSRKKRSEIDEVSEKIESITTAAINISDKGKNTKDKEEIFNENKPKRRGRPKKDVVLEKKTAKIEEKPKAKRGRPRKAK